jgi:hypothetical protein
MISAFGVDHGDSISKKVSESERKTKKDKNYRPSYLQGMNPRSRTYVKRGTGLQRVALPTLGASVGGPVGQTLGLSRNIASQDTRSYNKKTGRKATMKIGAGVGSFNVYGQNQNKKK